MVSLNIKYFIEANPLTAKISNLLRYLLRYLRTDLLRYLRTTWGVWGYMETEGRAFVSSSPIFRYFSSYNKSAGSNIQRRVRQTSWCSPNPNQREAIVHPICSPACCNSFFQILWIGEADFIGLTCLVL